jgi:HNH endonuclease
VHLESDEICHLETPATYHKVNAKSTTYLEGRLVATNKRLHFLSTGRGMTINWGNIMRVDVRSSIPTSNGVYLELSKGTGNGLYAVSDPTLVGTVLDTLVKIAKRQLVVTNAEPSRHIPQDVKNAVWQRDGGKCTQFGSTSYLEFDHIIPHTKGGANTLENVQLLCRNCNLKKSDRI